MQDFVRKCLDLALIIPNEETNEIMKILKSLKEHRLLIKGVSKTIKNEAKQQQENFQECYQVMQVLILQQILKYKSFIKLKINGAYSINNLPKIKYGSYVINLDEYKSIGNYWVAFYVSGSNGTASYNVIYFDSFRVEHILKEIKEFIVNKNVMQ